MKNKAIELLNKQMEARNVLAVEIIEEAKESLKVLGLEEMLSGVTTATKEVPVEIIKEVEVVKEVPVEVIKEIEVIKEVSSKEDKQTIAKLEKELKKMTKLKDYNKGVNETLRKQIKELKAVKPVTNDNKEVEELKATIESLKMELKNKEIMYQGLIKDLNDKIKTLSSQTSASKENKPKSNAKIHTEQKIKTQLPEELKVRNFDTHVIGTYKGIAFEAMKEIVGTTIYDPTRWDLKDELNEVLIANKLIQASREDKDMYRVECEQGSCHEINSNKFMGYVVVKGVSYNYVFDKNYNNGNGFASIVNTKQYLSNPSAKFAVCKNRDITNAINSLIDRHQENVTNFRKHESNELLAMIGLTAAETTVTADTTADTTNVITNAQLFEDETAVTKTTNTIVTEPIITNVKDTETIKTSQEELDEILAYGFDDEF